MVSRQCSWLLASVVFLALPRAAHGQSVPWTRHAIDDSSRGADGVRSMDVNGDGLLDITTAWEEGGKVRVYLNPGHAKSTKRWPAVTAGEVADPEDAVFVDLDGDGAVDVVSSCEGNTRVVNVHWAPKDKQKYLDPKAWATEGIPASKGKMWQFCQPMQIDGKGGLDLVVGGKNGKGCTGAMGWLESPAHPRNVADWKYHPLCDAAWVMSLVAVDMDGDGDLDVLASDRKEANRGCLWLEHPADPTTEWKKHPIGSVGQDEVMFLDLVDLDRDGLMDVLVPTRDSNLLLYRRKGAKPVEWELHPIQFPVMDGGGKAVRVGDINLDGKLDIVLTCQPSTKPTPTNLVWMSYRKAVTDLVWDMHDIGGPQGTKYDLAELVDLDGDGDLDVITTEEIDNLGLIWYENPSKGI